MASKNNPAKKSSVSDKSVALSEHRLKYRGSDIITELMENLQPPEITPDSTVNTYRATKVESLKRRIQTGNYRTDSEQIADALLRAARKNK